MNYGTYPRHKSCAAQVEQIMLSKASELERIVQAFDCITRFEISTTEHEIDLARAMGNHEQVPKIQIKQSTMRHTREVLRSCYMRATGRKPWNDDQE